MSEKISRLTTIFNKQILYSSNPYEEAKLRKLTDNIRKRILIEKIEASTTITNNPSTVRFNLSSINREQSVIRKIDSHRSNRSNLPNINSSKTIINTENNEKVQKELYDRIIYKKFLKGKLQKLLKSTVIIDKQRLAIMVRILP